MTPTLLGRWQTRVALLWTLGLAITAGYMWRLEIFSLGVRDSRFWSLIALLGYVTLLGLGWDVLYNHLQGFRWDRDWPLAFGFGCGVFEGAVVFVLFSFNLLPGIAYHAGDWRLFVLHYGTIFWVTYWWQLGPMRVIQPHWRFNGGELL